MKVAHYALDIGECIDEDAWHLPATSTILSRYARVAVRLNRCRLKPPFASHNESRVVDPPSAVGLDTREDSLDNFAEPRRREVTFSVVGVGHFFGVITGVERPTDSPADEEVG